jgi:hypothetical protein
VNNAKVKQHTNEWWTSEDKAKFLDDDVDEDTVDEMLANTLPPKTIELARICVEQGMFGADMKFVWNDVKFKCAHCNKPAVSMERVKKLIQT